MHAGLPCFSPLFCLRHIKMGKQDEFIAGNEHQVDMPNLTSVTDEGGRFQLDEEDMHQ